MLVIRDLQPRKIGSLRNQWLQEEVMAHTDILQANQTYCLSIVAADRAHPVREVIAVGEVEGIVAIEDRRRLSVAESADTQERNRKLSGCAIRVACRRVSTLCCDCPSSARYDYVVKDQRMMIDLVPDLSR